MSKYIHDGKVYDTATAKKAYSFRMSSEKYFNDSGELVMDATTVDIYWTPRGAWFSVAKDPKMGDIFAVSSEESVKALLMRRHAVAEYEACFGQLERA